MDRRRFHGDHDRPAGNPARAVFVLLLFVGEPLVLHRFFPVWARRDPGRALAVLHAVHVVLSLLTTLAAVAGSHGWMP